MLLTGAVNSANYSTCKLDFNEKYNVELNDWSSGGPSRAGSHAN